MRKSTERAISSTKWSDEEFAIRERLVNVKRYLAVLRVPREVCAMHCAMIVADAAFTDKDLTRLSKGRLDFRDKSRGAEMLELLDQLLPMRKPKAKKDARGASR